MNFIPDSKTYMLFLYFINPLIGHVSGVFPPPVYSFLGKCFCSFLSRQVLSYFPIHFNRDHNACNILDFVITIPETSALS